MRPCLLLFITLFTLSCASAQGVNIFQVTTGSVLFHSDARQELIKATSSELRGVVDIQKKLFAFRLTVSSFIGFNNQVQKEHFDENYMETGLFPEATYSGKIIEDIDLTKDGVYDVRAKGKLKIHGVEQERIIKARIVVKDMRIIIDSEFTVELADHGIKIPRVVYEKLAPEINVSVHAVLIRSKNS